MSYSYSHLYLNLYLYFNLNQNQNLYQNPYQRSHIEIRMLTRLSAVFKVRILRVWERPHVDASKASQSILLQRPGG